MSVASGASALVPFTQTFVQTSGSETTTVAYTLVGQVLDNGQTNWVGYDDGTANYLYTGSVANAQETTIAGDTYYVSSGSAPAGYLATESGDDDMATMTESSASETASESSATMTGTSSRSTTTRQSSSTSSGAAAETSQPSSGHRMSAGAAFALAVGLLAVVTL